MDGRAVIDGYEGDLFIAPAGTNPPSHFRFLTVAGRPQQFIYALRNHLPSNLFAKKRIFKGLGKEGIL
jgi:hypothetical protein